MNQCVFSTFYTRCDQISQTVDGCPFEQPLKFTGQDAIAGRVDGVILIVMPVGLMGRVCFFHWKDPDMSEFEELGAGTRVYQHEQLLVRVIVRFVGP